MDDKRFQELMKKTLEEADETMSSKFSSYNRDRTFFRANRRFIFRAALLLLIIAFSIMMILERTP